MDNSCSERKEACYDLIFPDCLINDITDQIFSFCESCDLLRYEPHIDGNAKTIAHLLCDAWEAAQNSNVNFEEWEKRCIEVIKKDLNFN